MHPIRDLILIFGSVIFALAICATILNYAISIHCTRVATQMNVEHTYSLLTNCMIKTPKGNWVPLSSFRTLD